MSSSTATSPATGYAHRGYAHSLLEFGTPLWLSYSQGWLLQRTIPNTDLWDAMGCYPLFSCQHWGLLANDFEQLRDRLVSVTLVSDPFGAYDFPLLQRSFPDLVVPFKEHFVIQLDRDPATFVCKHHQRNVRKALKKVEIQILDCAQSPLSAGLLESLPRWCHLYENLIARHRIRGIAAFSPAAFQQQFQVPGMVLLKALYQGETVGMALWYCQSEVAYYHLAAYSELGYQLNASFALFWQAIAHFSQQGLRWLNLGAGAGTQGQGSAGLSRFKQGWATGTRTAYLCGRILNASAYHHLSQSKIPPKKTVTSRYFPLYREGEFP